MPRARKNEEEPSASRPARRPSVVQQRREGGEHENGDAGGDELNLEWERKGGSEPAGLLPDMDMENWRGRAIASCDYGMEGKSRGMGWDARARAAPASSFRSYRPAALDSRPPDQALHRLPPSGAWFFG